MYDSYDDDPDWSCEHTMHDNDDWHGPYPDSGDSDRNVIYPPVDDILAIPDH